MLNTRDEIKALALINFYEYFFGVVSGTLLDFSMAYTIPYKKGRSILLSIPLALFLIVCITTFVLYIRVHSVDYLPILKDMELKKQENFTHPPPLAFAFGFWQTQKQLKLRNSNLYSKMSVLLKKK